MSENQFTMFTTPWCGYCHRLKSQLDREGITFDIVDSWMDQSIAGCQYHVMHPGGRNYDQYPVNSYEAESRRLARFTRLAHTPGRVQAGRPDRSLEFPYTLDLRTLP